MANNFSKLRKADLVALVLRYSSGLAIGRKKGAQVQRLGAALRQSLIDRAVGDLLSNSETAKWRTGALVVFLYGRQAEIGLRLPYSRSSLDRRVRRAIRKYRAANFCQSPTKNASTLAA